MSKKAYIYVLPKYANPENLENIRSATEDEYRIKYSKDGFCAELTETNSLIEDEYCLNLKSAHYTLEGIADTKESMIHHHRKGETLRHLQFKLKSKRKVIRVMLDPLDDADYENCIKGFLYISCALISNEQRAFGIKDNLQNYFFSKSISSLKDEKNFLLLKIKSAYEHSQITADKSNPVDQRMLLELRKENQLQPFLDW
jgi:hypothetical protein